MAVATPVIEFLRSPHFIAGLLHPLNPCKYDTKQPKTILFLLNNVRYNTVCARGARDI
jgi:hypothetical protein